MLDRSPQPIWRFIPFLVAPGAIQMAIDTWLLQQHQAGTHLPTLRFHRWTPTAVSLGHFQRRIPDHWHHLEWQGQSLDLVRRPTGGRAVLHQGDLVYTLVTQVEQGARMGTYRYLCEFLIQGWRQLGLFLDYGDRERRYASRTSCFATATGADLVDEGGNKFIGSAQRYCRQSVLQHGSMQLDPDPDLFTEVFGETPPKAQFPILAEDATLLGTVMEVLINAAQRHFQADFVIQPLSEREWAEIHQLACYYQMQESVSQG